MSKAPLQEKIDVVNTLRAFCTTFPDLEQRDIANMIGISQSSVSSWLLNKTLPRASFVPKIYEALDAYKSKPQEDVPPQTSIFDNDSYLQALKRIGDGLFAIHGTLKKLEATLSNPEVINMPATQE